MFNADLGYAETFGLFPVRHSGGGKEGVFAGVLEWRNFRT